MSSQTIEFVIVIHDHSPSGAYEPIILSLDREGGNLDFGWSQVNGSGYRFDTFESAHAWGEENLGRHGAGYDVRDTNGNVHYRSGGVDFRTREVAERITGRVGAQ